MITKDNEPIYKQPDGNYTIIINGNTYGVCDNNPKEPYTKEMVEAYLADHPDALIPEPVPPEPTQEELDKREEQELRGYLAKTDWYAIRFAETGKEVPLEVVTNRANARARISELRG